MIVGIPGTGIGGLFYLLIAIWMPIRELATKIRGHVSHRWALVKEQLGMVVLIVLGMWATGELIGLVLQVVVRNTSIRRLGPLGHISLQWGRAAHAHNYLELTPFFLSLVVLALVYVGVNVLTLIVPAPADGGPALPAEASADRST